MLLIFSKRSKFAWCSIVEVQSATDGSLERLLARLRKSQDGRYVKHLRVPLDTSPYFCDPNSPRITDSFRLDAIVDLCPNLVSLGLDWEDLRCLDYFPIYPQTLQFLSCRVESVSALRGCLHPSLTHLVLSSAHHFWTDSGRELEILRLAAPLLTMLVFDVECDAQYCRSFVLDSLDDVLADTPDCLCVLRLAPWKISQAAADMLERTLAWANRFFILDVGGRSDDPEAARIIRELASMTDELLVGQQAGYIQSTGSDGIDSSQEDASGSEGDDGSSDEDVERDTSDDDTEFDSDSETFWDDNPVRQIASMARWRALYAAFPSSVYVPSADELLPGGVWFIGGTREAEEGRRPFYERLAEWKEEQEKRMGELTSEDENESDDD